MRNPRFGFLPVLLFLLAVSFVPVRPASADVTLTASQCGSECAGLLNTSLANNNVVTLGAGTYNIDSTVRLKSGNTLTGPRGAVIRLINNAAWDRYIPMLTAPSGASNIKIYGFEIDGNKANNQDYDANYAANDNTKADHKRYYGHSYYDMITLRSVSNIEIHDMYLHHNLGDIVLFNKSSNLKFYNNTERQQGHATVYAYQSRDIWAYNNNVEVFCNAGMRSDGSTNYYIYNNTFSQVGGQAAIELQGTGEIWVCNNNFGNATQYDKQAGGSNPFTGTIHTTGCPAAGTSGAPSASSSSTDNGATGDGGSSDGGADGSSGGTGTSTDGSGTSTPPPPPEDSDAEFSGGTGAGGYQANATQAAVGGATTVTGLYQPPADLPATATTACRVDETANNSAGLIPCGRSANDPATPWNECNACTLFSMILMGQLAVEFLVKMAAIAAVLSIIAGGFLYVFAAGREQLITQAKSMITAVLTGFTIILIAWVIVDAILSSLGYINPLGGEWYALENPQANAN